MEASASSFSPTPQKGTNDNPVTEGGDGSHRKSSVTAPLLIGPQRRGGKAVRQRRSERASTTESEVTEFLWEEMSGLCIVGDVAPMVRPPTPCLPQPHAYPNSCLPQPHAYSNPCLPQPHAYPNPMPTPTHALPQPMPTATLGEVSSNCTSEEEESEEEGEEEECSRRRGMPTPTHPYPNPTLPQPIPTPTQSTH